MVKFLFLAKSIVDFEFLGKHFKAAHGALVVPGAVVGNYWTSILCYILESILWMQIYLFIY